MRLWHGQEEMACRDMSSASVLGRDSEGNACEEGFICVFKENLLWVGTSLMWRNGASV